MDQELNEVFQKYEGKREELIPLLQDVQGKLGYLPAEARTAIGKFLNVPESVVFGVATFYAQFYLTRQGKHKIKVCRGTACHVRGGRRIMQAVQRKLGIKPGETTPDYEFSLERVACFGSCALAPVVVVDGKVHGRMTTQKAEQIVKGLMESPGEGAEG
jgi:NADH:ubiquinone oxidoreductase subunit E